MAAAAEPFSHASVTPVERTIITIAVMMGMVMQVLDATIANVALPHMQASLGVTPETINWVLTSYIVSAAIAIPITGWLAEKVGRKRLFVWSVILFTAASMLCALAQNLPEMVLFRVLQGVSGAFIAPLAQAVMFDINPPERHAKAMALFGGGVMIGPILGPVLGGWLTDSFNWRWVFLINLPIGIITTLLLLRYLPKTSQRPHRFDLFGFVLLALALGGLQMMLDRGEQLDWFESWEIWIEAAIAASAAWMFAVHMATSRHPLFDPKLFADRNFVTGLVFMVAVGVLMLAGLALLPPFLQRLMGYSVFESGVLTAPRGVGTLVSMLIAGQLVGKVDSRLLIAAGVGLMAFSLWQMSGFSLEMDQHPIIVSGIIQGLGLGLIFVPLNTLAFGTLPAHYRTTAASLLNLARNLGGSVGISVVTTLLARNIQISHADLAAEVDGLREPMIQPGMIEQLGVAGDAALALINAEINRQAAMIAYIDDFYFMMIVSLCVLPLVLLLRKPSHIDKQMVIVD